MFSFVLRRMYHIIVIIRRVLVTCYYYLLFVIEREDIFLFGHITRGVPMSNKNISSRITVDQMN